MKARAAVGGSVKVGAFINVSLANRIRKIAHPTMLLVL
jgi:hypothetical protein